MALSPDASPAQITLMLDIHHAPPNVQMGNLRFSLGPTPVFAMQEEKSKMVCVYPVITDLLLKKQKNATYVPTDSLQPPTNALASLLPHVQELVDQLSTTWHVYAQKVACIKITNANALRDTEKKMDNALNVEVELYP